MGQTKIEWTEATWNPVTGCTKVSEGCRNCYAERVAKRLAGRHGYPADEPFRVTTHLERLREPLERKKPTLYFVCSMSDLFHKNVPDEVIDMVFAAMGAARHHTFQVLTKRPDRMAEYLSDRWRLENIYAAWNAVSGGPREVQDWPLPNVWVGTSVEHQQAADERIPDLLRTPAAVRFLSCEPLLEAVYLGLPGTCPKDWGLGYTAVSDHLHWVICGGESGLGARPMHPDWARSLRDQCVSAGVPYFLKQWGEWLPNAQEYGCHQPEANYNRRHVMLDDVAMARVGKHAAGRLLDGRTWDEMPSVGGGAE